MKTYAQKSRDHQAQKALRSSLLPQRAPVHERKTARLRQVRLRTLKPQSIAARNRDIFFGFQAGMVAPAIARIHGLSLGAVRSILRLQAMRMAYPAG